MHFVSQINLPFLIIDKDENEITIADLYPQLTAEEQAEAKENWLRYLRVMRRIFEHIVREKPEVLTELEKLARLRKESERKS